MLVAIGFIEVVCGSVLVSVSKGESTREAGDFGLDPLRFLEGKGKEERERMQLAELKNARLAMLAFAGVVTQAGLGEASQSFPYF